LRKKRRKAYMVQPFRSTEQTDPEICCNGKIDRLHGYGIRCNFCGKNCPAKARKMFEMGIDCLLTDGFLRVKTDLDRE